MKPSNWAGGRPRTMLIAQITDIHLGFDPDNPAEYNRKRLAAVLRALCRMSPRPDLLLATGDLVDQGDADSYRRLRGALDGLPFPVRMVLGNHDRRDTFRAEFPEAGTIPSGHVQYVEEAGPVRLVMLDTLDEGRHGGAFCEPRARWLTDRLAEAPGRPTLLVLHHPPIETGIPWMTTALREPWVERLRGAIAGQPQVMGMICGHIHRSLVTRWAGGSVAVCSSTAPQVALELAAIDPETPDGRPMIVADPPAYALHYWNGESLVTHFETADDHVALASYDDRMQGLVRHLLAERPRG